MTTMTDRQRRALCLQAALTPLDTTVSRRQRRVDVEEKISHLYRQKGFSPPKFKWYRTPHSFMRGLHYLRMCLDFAKEITPFAHGYFFNFKREDKTLQGLHDILRTQVNQTARNLSDAINFFASSSTAMRVKDDFYLDLSKDILSWFPATRVCYILEKFTSIHLDGHGRLHNLDGPAMTFGRTKIYAVNGQVVPKSYFRVKKGYCWLEIYLAENPGDQVALIDIYGREKFIRNKGDRLTVNGKYGLIWMVHMPIVHYRTDMRIGNAYFVEVFNSTPDANGVKASSFLRIPVSVAHSSLSAVAWTFGMSETEYKNGLLAES